MTDSTKPAPLWIGARPGETSAAALLGARRVDCAGLADILRGDARQHVAASVDHARALALALEFSARIETLTLLSPPPLESLDADFVAKLKGLEIPTLLLFGAVSAPNPAAPGTLWRRALGKAHLVYIFDAADPIDAARPEAVARVMGDFLARKDGFLVRAADDRIDP